MTGRDRRRSRSVKCASGAVSDGAERYMWAFPDGDEVVLSIPGLRDLKLSPDDARTAGQMLIETAEEVSKHGSNRIAVSEQQTESN